VKLQETIENLKHIEFKPRKNKFKKQLNLLPKAYVERYKAKSLALKIAILWVSIFLLFIIARVRISELNRQKVNELTNITLLQENYTEANELVLRINELTEEISRANNMLIYLGSENDYEQYISRILQHISPLSLSQLSFNTSEMAVTLTVAGRTELLPFVMESLQQDGSFYDVIIRSSTAEGLDVRFVIDFYVKNRLYEGL